MLVGIVDEIPCVVFIDWLSAEANDGRDITEASEGRTPLGSIITAVAGAVLLIDEQESLLFQANCDVNVILSETPGILVIQPSKLQANRVESGGLRGWLRCRRVVSIVIRATVVSES